MKESNISNRHIAGCFIYAISEERYMGKEKTIYCPRCGRKVMMYDGKTQTPLSITCKHCQKLVTYFPTNDDLRINNIPARNTSSGMRFY